MSNEARATVSRILAEANVNFAVQHIALTTREDWDCDEWRVTLGIGKTAQVFSFFTGLGHRKIDAVSEARIKREYGPHYRNTVAYKQAQKPVAPSAADVLYSLLLDADANNSSFLDWCADLGYDSDSIKALNTYNACCETAQQLRKVFKSETLEALREALTDY